MGSNSTSSRIRISGTQVIAVLFDLDQTLIDSRQAEPLRRARRWRDVYPLIPGMRPYAGISKLLAELAAAKTPLCVVTSAPSSYCSRVLAQWRWTFNATVSYHDTTRHKPYPDPIVEALRRLHVGPSEAIAVGDAPPDIGAARAAGVFAIGALWGSLDPNALLACKPDACARTVSALRTLLPGSLAAGGRGPG